MVRMIDVAEKAGVSLKTVSRVLNNEPHVQDKLRQRVLDTVEALGYVPSMSARSLRSSRTYTLHLITRNIEGNFINTVQSGALRACQKHGYNLLATMLSFEILNDPKALRKWCKEFIETKRPDGVILVPPHSDNPLFNQLFSEANIPISRIGPNDIDDKNNANITIDDRSAARDVTEYLISLGHRRIGFVRGYEDQGATHRRYDGYCDALNAANIQIDPELVKPGKFSFESGMEAGRELLNMDNRPTAIFAANDDMAAGVIVTAYMNNLKIPEDISVAGFDDSELAARIWPSLSTVRQPLLGYGASAVQYLVAKAGNGNKSAPDTPTISDILDYEFIIRASTGPVSDI